MSGVATAIGIGAAATVAGTVYAADTSANATKSATNAAVTEQQNALTQQEALAAPYTKQGQAGIQTYNALTSANPQQVQQTLQNTPGYQATYGQGVEGAERAAAASGLNLSGNQVAGVESFGAQLGDSTYQQAINNALGQEQIGQAAAAGTAANIGQTATNVAGETISQGTNLANIESSEIAGITRAGSGATNSYLTYNALQGLSNPGGGGGPSAAYYNYGGSLDAGPPGAVAPGTYYTPTDLNAGP
jgi:hypothetical protein